MELDKDGKKKILWTNVLESEDVGHLKSETGKSIYLRRVRVGEALKHKAQDRTRIVFLHDMLEHHGRYIETFKKNFSNIFLNLEIIFIDFPGHGLSNGTRGHFESLDSLVDDLGCVLDGLDPSLNFYFIGHGLGALVFLRFLLFKNAQKNKHLLNGFKGLVASNFYFDFSKRINPMVKILDLVEKRTKTLSQIHVDHIKLNRLIHGEDLSYQREVQEKYEADPLVVHRMSYHSLRSMEQGIIEISHKAYFLDFPFLCLMGKNDPIINSDKLNLFMKSIEKKFCRVIELPDSKHDLYNDNDSSFVIKEIVQWMQYEKK